MATKAQDFDFAAVPEASTFLRRARRETFKFVRTKPFGTAGFLILFAFLVVGIFREQFQRVDPAQADFFNQLVGPGSDFWLGSDNQGRDVYSRLVHGCWIAIEVGVMAPLLAMIAGTTIGVVSGYFGGWVDMIVQRFVDAMLAFPAIVLGLAIVTALQPSIRNIIIAIAVISTPGFSRIVRASVLSAKQNAYVEAAGALGQTPVMIMYKHILPNVAAPIIVITTASVGTAILAEAGISFLGFGDITQPSWGQMMSTEARAFLSQAWWLAVMPGTAIALAVLAANLFGDALRDVLDPRLRNL